MRPPRRALASWKIEELAEAIDKKETRDVLQYAHEQFALELIHQFIEKPERLSLPRPAEPPPGQPIGCDP